MSFSWALSSAERAEDSSLQKVPVATACGRPPARTCEPLGLGGNGQVEHVTVLVDEVIHLVAGYSDDLMPVGEVAHQPPGKFDAPIAVRASAIQLLPQTLCEPFRLAKGMRLLSDEFQRRWRVSRGKRGFRGWQAHPLTDRDDANPSIAILEVREELGGHMLLRGVAAG